MNTERLISLLKGHNVYIQTHNFPDPDAIASAFGLQSFLKCYGICSRICYDGTIEKLTTKRMLTNFNIEIFNKYDINDMKDTDYIVTIDAQKFNANITDFKGLEVACIDHHPTFVPCEYKYSDIRLTGACSTIIAEYFYQSNVEIDNDVAAALAYGIKMDTSEFTRGVTELDIDMFSYLYKKSNRSKLNAMYTNVMEFNDLKAYAAAIESIVVYDRVGFASIPFDCPDALIATISDFIMSLDVVRVAIVYARREDGLKISVRSEEEDINAGVLTSEALKGYGNGGGHPTMAGGFIPLETVEPLGDDLDYKIKTVFLEKLDRII